MNKSTPFNERRISERRISDCKPGDSLLCEAYLNNLLAASKLRKIRPDFSGLPPQTRDLRYWYRVGEYPYCIRRTND